MVNQAAQTCLACKQGEVFTVYNATPDFGKEALFPERKLFEEKFSHNQTQNRITEKLETLIVFFTLNCRRMPCGKCV
jgi:hypothetical protein